MDGSEGGSFYLWVKSWTGPDSGFNRWLFLKAPERVKEGKFMHVRAKCTYVKLAVVIPGLMLLASLVALPQRSSEVRAEITPAPSTAQAQIQLTPETPPEICGTCHTKQYQEWKESWMGRALATPPMIMMQRLYMATAKNPNAAYCLRCHSPLMEPLGKTEQILQEVLFGEVKSQSIGCTGCHLISELTFNPNDPKSVSHNNPNQKFRVSLPEEGEMITSLVPSKTRCRPFTGRLIGISSASPRCAPPATSTTIRVQEETRPAARSTVPGGKARRLKKGRPASHATCRERPIKR